MELKPVTPSKIPVGHFRLEEEKAINRVLNGKDSNRMVNSNRSSSPSSSRIPKFFGSNYMRVKVNIFNKYLRRTLISNTIQFQDKIEKTSNTKTETQAKLRAKSQDNTWSSASSQIAILSR